ncbi:MAG: hypothetical protein ABSG15_04500 [FCB group bacterium]|jgi:hypothetical protein
MKLKLIIIFALIFIAGCGKPKVETPSGTPVSPGFPAIKEWYGAKMNDMLKFNDDGTGLVQSFTRRMDTAGNFVDSVHHSFKTKWTYNPKSDSEQIVIELLHPDGTLWDRLASKAIENGKLTFKPATHFKFDSEYIPKGIGEKQRKQTFELLTAGKWKLVKAFGKPYVASAMSGHGEQFNIFNKDGSYEANNQASWQLLGEEGRYTLTVDRMGNGAIQKIIEVTPTMLKIRFGKDYQLESEFKNFK